VGGGCAALEQYAQAYTVGFFYGGARL